MYLVRKVCVFVIALKIVCNNVGKGLFGVIVVHGIVVEESCMKLTNDKQ
jgi:hypothetical protein